MKTSKLKLLWYILWSIIIISWIVFLFLDAKGYHISLDSVKSIFSFANTDENPSKGSVDWDEVVLSEEDLAFLSWFLQEDTKITTKDAASLWNIKEKIAILEQIYTQQRTLEVVQLLIDAYMLDNQYEKVKKFYNTLPEAIQWYLDPALLFKIGVNSFSQTTETEYKSLKQKEFFLMKNHFIIQLLFN